MKKLGVVFVLFCVFFKMFAEDENDKLRLAVMEFEDKSGKLSKATLSNATEYIRGAFVASNKYIVIAKERQENAIIKQMKKESHKLCNDKNCQIPLGQALSADTILRTTITFFAKKYTIISELIDLAKEATIKGAKATFNDSEESLNEALDNIVAQIVGQEMQKEISAQNFPNKQAAGFSGTTKNSQNGQISSYQSNTALEHLTIHWSINSRPQGADCSWRIKSSTPDVKNQNERYLSATPYESTETFDIKGLTYNNAGNVQVEVKCTKAGFYEQKKVFGILSVIDEKEISAMFILVKEK